MCGRLAISSIFRDCFATKRKGSTVDIQPSLIEREKICVKGQKVCLFIFVLFILKLNESSNSFR